MAACTTDHSFLQSDTLPQFRHTASLSYNEILHFITTVSGFYYNEVVNFITQECHFYYICTGK